MLLVVQKMVAPMEVSRQAVFVLVVVHPMFLLQQINGIGAVQMIKVSQQVARHIERQLVEVDFIIVQGVVIII
tara:strand:- start:731 stop:949 length:219 start_codon:yes stop_codon:yes gene_type:complete